MVQVVRLLREHPAGAAHRAVSLDREPIVDAPVEELRQGVLKDRQRTRLTDHVAQQLGEQGGLARDASAGCRLGRSLLELVGGERQHVHDT